MYLKSERVKNIIAASVILYYGNPLACGNNGWFYCSQFETELGLEFSINS